MATIGLQCYVSQVHSSVLLYAENSMTGIHGRSANRNLVKK